MMMAQRPHQQEASSSAVPRATQHQTGIGNPLSPFPETGEPDPDRLLDIREAAALLHLSPRTVQGYLKSHELIGTRLGRLWRITLADLRAFINKHRDTDSTN